METNKQKHIPVMLQEVISNLNINENDTIVDLTIGYGGHSSVILSTLKSSGRLVGFDKDSYAIKKSSERLSQISQNFKLFKSDFSNFDVYLKENEIFKVDGILVDLGISSVQIDTPERGFSYNKDSRLDMRMDQNQTLDAWKVINEYALEDLIRIFDMYGQVKLSKRIAQHIIKNRPINSTLQLVEVIKSGYPAALNRQKNMAKPIFQAIRIEVNNEFDSIKIMLNKALEFLKKGSKLLIITFHSLEDKIVKQFYKSLIKTSDPKLPIMIKQIYKTKTINPSHEEIFFNKRARSAKLRILEKIDD
ncbi:16S rRNA (cytosine(1402)-N(4))-methyltransferase RsmH [Mycoplasma phocimorsus]|uniref:Ribosomal RNA small subunit methyltransferase H n=1 Tax=Mycoplasma phocimorsus TaxID=3045839 RepID=A0AAJ1UVQ2_9MOLU|nr:16S rRNA (cytosine(1402)-N(4))-methyltransferase RsmH [Mycoplasma phocimorsus]MDJ1645779.1 16S rRNA (cytosine(1402)-N(4))-methyltransferase RsmH [Mycoplasma phocimorsus]MDJ1646328.1 16S rRNA (cytosine(1402)-N(4))-methyltransferase RsmH [Mycoplasma phocimorsus]MDJ1647251.1 16S rRNA (cytosine(1402)-N(4))-methyltransferase RsmH [Mycoplasma phocimorsus]MDJ1647899.1 16S rRNA (cytosine(1402)-N(4))-methyltransferase RsmH [Mycoplasma phocimorsus]MDJ1648393.1 16S rRNA (cytosine(1402)-N(4))-methyltra